jgi:hypothetical protein
VRQGLGLEATEQQLLDFDGRIGLQTVNESK